MIKICIVDDDFAIEQLAQHLLGEGYEVLRYTSAEEAFKNLKELAEKDLIILDVMMESPNNISSVATHGGYRTGLLLAQELRKLNACLPIIAFSATQDKDVIEWFNEKKNSRFINKWNQPSLKEFDYRIKQLLGIPEKLLLPTPFIVHGQNEKRKLELKNYLQNTLEFPEPIILHEQPSQGKTILEKFEYYSAQSKIVFVLLTPDDVVVSNDESDEKKRRARQNVIFELGYFLCLFGRHSGRVLLLHEGTIELPSDISGLIYIDIKDGIEASGEKIRKEVDHAIK